jgi:hypothetical protein
MTETKVPDIPNAIDAYKQSQQRNPNGFIQRILTQLNSEINTAIEKGRFEVKLEWNITGAGIVEQYRDASRIIRRYYQDQGYSFESAESWVDSEKYYNIWW